MARGLARFHIFLELACLTGFSSPSHIFTEEGGFEPPVPISRNDGLANRCLKPLGHPSLGVVNEAALQETLDLQLLIPQLKIAGLSTLTSLSEGSLVSTTRFARVPAEAGRPPILELVNQAALKEMIDLQTLIPRLKIVGPVP